MRHLAWIVAAGLALPGGARAQVNPSPEPSNAPRQADGAPAGSMEVAAQLWAVIGRYRFAATADRVRVTLVRPGGRSDMLSLVVRCVPGAAGLARLELGDLTLVARDGKLIAVHDRDPTTYAELDAPEGARDPASVLRALLPPLAIPQLSLAFDPGRVEWCPLVSDLTWENAERVAIDGYDGVRLVGATDTGRASIELAGARVRRFEADLESDGQTRLIVECEPLGPGDPSGWTIDVASRRRVSGIAALRPLGVRFGVGDRFPLVRAVTVGSQREVVLGREADPPGLFPETRYYAALLLHDDTPVETTRSIAETALHAVTDFQRELLRGRLDGRFDKRVRLAGTLGVIQAQTTGGMLDRIARLSGAWLAAEEASRPSATDRPELAWTGGEARLIDRLAPGATGVLVLYDGTGVIRAIVPVEADSGEDAVSASLIGGFTGVNRTRE